MHEGHCSLHIDVCTVHVSFDCMLPFDIIP